MPASKSFGVECAAEGLSRPTRTALTGGIASGKSTVARMFQEKGAIVLDADEAARRAVQPGQPAWNKLRAILDAGYFDAATGELNRKKLREDIVRDLTLRAQVNAAVHPSVMEAMEAAWREVTARDPHRIVLFDIPLLYEVGLQDAFDCVIVVYADPEKQVERLCRRDGVSPEEARKTLTMQWPIAWKKDRAHLVIDNSGDIKDTRRQVEALWTGPLQRMRSCRKDTYIPTTS
ncbi:dephospho-CoA kinase [Desulfosoma caldarium]|uniref:Dephospho-CoA kinase n=1 Tax=Desulfosoma caldarium TaxID=610254 RepID=A0A3N1VMB9_9BACT|nr:dephospho-CoA kinase [Desulfosoma caldarium]ROR03209.1 dephospho-CoA kinase [Desulfosoma caldarium]